MFNVNFDLEINLLLTDIKEYSKYNDIVNQPLADDLRSPFVN